MQYTVLTLFIVSLLQSFKLKKSIVNRVQGVQR